MYRPFTAASSTDMNIIADPDNTDGLLTSYTFRGNFGPKESVTDK